MLSKKQNVQNSEDSRVERKACPGTSGPAVLSEMKGEVNLHDLKGIIAPSRGGSYSITLLACCSSALRINSYLGQRTSIPHFRKKLGAHSEVCFVTWNRLQNWLRYPVSHTSLKTHNYFQGKKFQWFFWMDLTSMHLHFLKYYKNVIFNTLYSCSLVGYSFFLVVLLTDY